MVTTGYLDIIKSSEQYGLTGSNLVQMERKSYLQQTGESKYNILAVPGSDLAEAYFRT